MAEYIDRVEIFKTWRSDPAPATVASLTNAIFRAPSADVRPVIHGSWILYPRAHYFKCSICRYTVPYRKAMPTKNGPEYKYCPHCGAEMKENK